MSLHRQHATSPTGTQDAEQRASTRSAEILDASLRRTRVGTDRMFAGLMLAQWIFGVFCALVISPFTWLGAESSIHVHVFAAIGLGGLLAALPIWLALTAAGEARTRYAIAVSQGLFSALLIHLTGGRIETHFHVFGSLAFLAFYRDFRVIAIATAVVGVDHFVRGTLWPQSVFGVTSPGSWRWLEHVGWVVFEDAILLFSIRRGLSEMSEVAARQAEMEATRSVIEAKVDARTAELSVARDQAIEAARTKAEFLANMSHEIRTPMNGVLGFIQLLRQSPLSEEQADFVETIEGCGESLMTILNEILDFSKIEAGRMSVESIPFEPAHALDTVGHMLAAGAAARDIELVCRTEDLTGLTLAGDPTRLQQIFVNLCSNALKFTPAGGEVFLDARLVNDTPDSCTVAFSVTDTGIGIPAHRMDGLFRPFEQVDGSTTRRFGGTGLGLAICKRIVDLMGGEIVVTSEEGKGSEFTVTVPFRRIAVGGSRTPDLDGCQFLVVDDNPTNRRLLDEILTRAGATVTTCADAASALTVLEEADADTFDAGLLDYQMPEMDGLELARAVRASDRVAELPLVLLTSVDGLEAAEIDEAGFWAHQIKPIRATALLELLASRFSAIEAPPPIQPAEPAPAPVDASGARVLLVEDNPVNLRLARTLLRRRGYEVTSCENGREAVDTFACESFDVVIMDVQMPVMDGFAATAEMRKHEETHGGRTPIIALTAHALTGYREQCLDAGMDDYLTKPIVAAELDRVLDEVMARAMNKSA